MVSYDLPLYMLKIETTTRGTNSMPFLIFQRDHFRSGDHLRSGIICGAVQLKCWLISVGAIRSGCEALDRADETLQLHVLLFTSDSQVFAILYCAHSSSNLRHFRGN